MYKFWLYKFDIRTDYLEMTPVEITVLKPPPKDWNNISIDGLTLKLRMSRYKKVQSNPPIDPGLGCISEMGSLIVDDIVPSKEILKLLKEKNLAYPTISYQEELAAFKSTPADISVFNSRSKNIRAFINQVYKAACTAPVRQILVVDTGGLKAICTIWRKQKKGYAATVHAFNQDETVSFHLMLLHYKETDLLERDLFGILAGISMPDHTPDADQVDKDIKKIVAKFNKGILEKQAPGCR